MKRKCVTIAVITFALALCSASTHAQEGDDDQKEYAFEHLKELEVRLGGGSPLLSANSLVVARCPAVKTVILLKMAAREHASAFAAYAGCDGGRRRRSGNLSNWNGDPFSVERECPGKQRQHLLLELAGNAVDVAALEFIECVFA